MRIEHKEDERRGKFFAVEDGKEVGEVIYSKADDGCLVIEHTQVDEELRNQHLGNDLIEKTVNYAREKGWKVSPVCPFAAALFQRNDSWSDLLV